MNKRILIGLLTCFFMGAGEVRQPKVLKEDFKEIGVTFLDYLTEKDYLYIYCMLNQ